MDTQVRRDQVNTIVDESFGMAKW